MGNSSGSYTAKAHITPLLYPFTKWVSADLKQFLIRGTKDLPETFGIRRFEFEFLVGEEIDVDLSRALFQDVFDSDKNGLVDKLEVMCLIAMTSKVASVEKVHFFFDIFNFNDKGYLNESEITLLLMAVTRGAFRIDKKFHPPSAKVIDGLTREALEFARTESNGIRKPELVQFVVNNPSVTAYLECWRGHTSQVLVAEATQWRDLSFPCDIHAIAPTFAWNSLGLPPEPFVYWKRRDKIGTESGMEFLFAHTQSFLKTIDRRKVFKGSGVLGNGHLQQGFLADRWLLNAVSALVGKPETLLSLFPSTGQEEEGRFCVRLYEGGRWRSVYVDDRFPCAPTGLPLFASSSCSFEAWPCILEKAVAKYFGSYGHVARASVAPDATLAALRLFTGGHVLRYAMADFDWKSISDDVRGENGLLFVQQLLREESIVCVGRSCVTALTATTSKYTTPPLGRLFPVVAIATSGGFQYLVLKDTWGLITDTDTKVNTDSGHSGTFQIKVEDATMFFDQLVVSRFPDSLRASLANREVSLLAKLTGHEKGESKRWKTEVLQQTSSSPSAPAMFLVQVAHATATAADATGHAIVDSRRLDADATSEDFPFRLKDRQDFSREAGRMRRNVVKDTDVAAAAAGDSSKSKKVTAPDAKATASSTSKFASKSNGNAELVDVCITVSSSLDWSFAGNPDVGSRVRMRLIPSQQTKEKIRARELLLKAQAEREVKACEERREVQERLMEVIADEGSQPQEGSSSNFTSPKVRSRRQSMLSKSSEQHTVLLSNESELSCTNKANRDYTRYLELVFTAQRSWMSQSLLLLPGDYYLLANVECDCSFLDAMRLSMPRDIADAPWVDAAVAAEINKADSEKYLTMALPEEASVISETSIQKLEKQMFGANPNRKTMRSPTKSALSADASFSTNSVSSLLRQPKTFEHSLWAEVSSTESVSLIPINSATDLILVSRREGEEGLELDISTADSVHTSKDVLPPGMYIHASRNNQVELPFPLLPTSVTPETWPFLAECQQEVCSRELIRMMSSIRDDAESLGEEFVMLAMKVHDERKRLKALMKAKK